MNNNQSIKDIVLGWDQPLIHSFYIALCTDTGRWKYGVQSFLSTISILSLTLDETLIVTDRIFLPTREAVRALEELVLTPKLFKSKKVINQYIEFDDTPEQCNQWELTKKVKELRSSTEPPYLHKMILIPGILKKVHIQYDLSVDNNLWGAL